MMPGDCCAPSNCIGEEEILMEFDGKSSFDLAMRALGSE